LEKVRISRTREQIAKLTGLALGFNLTPERCVSLIVCASLATILGAKLVLIAGVGSMTPFWDQWDAEAAFLYKPYLEGTLRFSDLVAPHNEHRILWSRLLSLALLELNGRWDPVLQMIVNAFIHVAALGVMMRLLGRALEPWGKALLAVFTALVFALPFGWENTLAGFQSQFCLLLLFSFLCFQAGFDAEGLSLRWWAAVALAIGAFFSLASGALTLLALMSLHGLQIIARQRSGWREWVAAGLGLMVVAIILAHVPTLDRHAALKAHSIKDFISGVVTIASWPLSWHFAGLILANLPLALFVLAAVRRPIANADARWLYVVVAGWMALQVISLAYGRFNDGRASRYLDIVSVLVVLNFSCLLFLTDTLRPHQWRLPMLWGGLMVASILTTCVESLPSAIYHRHQQTMQQTLNLKAFLMTSDFAHLAGKPLLAIPYFDADRLRVLASDSTILSILPRDLTGTSKNESVNLKLRLRGVAGSLIKGAKWLAVKLSPLLLGISVTTLLFSIFFELSGVRHTRSTEPSN
jgi:hypothetical protein